MKTSLKTISLLASAALFTLTSLSAVETDPVGYKTVTIKGDSGFTFIGVELLNVAAFTGAPSGVAANAVTVSGVDFDTLLDSNSSYFFDIINSSDPSKVGLNTLVSSWSGDSLTLSEDLSSVLTSGEMFRVRSLPTIGDIFGTNEILTGGSATTADLIFMPDAEGAGLLKIYYSTGGLAGTGWRIVGEGAADASNTPIYFSDGLFILKKSAGDSTLTLSGDVKVTSSSVVVDSGFTPYSTIFPSGTTLGNSGLYDPENLPQSITAGSATTADRVYLDSDGDGDLEIYYYSSGGLAGQGWRQIGSGSSDMASTPLDSGFGILRRSDSAVSLARSPAY